MSPRASTSVGTATIAARASIAPLSVSMRMQEAPWSIAITLVAKRTGKDEASSAINVPYPEGRRQFSSDA